jgi:hypothetical protein
MTKEEIGSLYFGPFIASTIPLALIYIGYASRVIGLILLAIFLIYITWFSRSRIVNEQGTFSNERKKKLLVPVFDVVRRRGSGN